MRARKCTASLQEVPTGAASLRKSRPVLLRPSVLRETSKRTTCPKPSSFFPSPQPWVLDQMRRVCPDRNSKAHSAAVRITIINLKLTWGNTGGSGWDLKSSA